MRISDWSQTCALPIYRVSRLLYDSLTSQGSFLENMALKAALSPNALRSALDNVLTHLFGHTILSVGLLATITEITLVRGSEERRVGTERVCMCRSRWSPYH